MIFTEPSSLPGTKNPSGCVTQSNPNMSAVSNKKFISGSIMWHTVKSLIEPPWGLAEVNGGLNLSPKCQEIRDKHDKEGKGFLPKYKTYYMARIRYKTLPEH